jgi:flavin reductase (DIM6/NTAB) family NADH-FMN oxidoreductase RutF
MDEQYFYQPSQGHGLPHDPFNAIVGPRPIGWISTRAADGILNLAPYSFFNAFNYTPPLIGFASLGRKDTLRNIEQTGEFVESGHPPAGRGHERQLRRRAAGSGRIPAGRLTPRRRAWSPCRAWRQVRCRLNASAARSSGCKARPARKPIAG